VAQAVYAGYEAAVIRAADALSLLASLVPDPEPTVSASLVDLLEDSKDHLVDPADRPAVMKKAEEIYRPVLAKVGLKPKGPNEDVRLTERRASAAFVLVVVAESSATRKELAPLGKAYLGPGPGGDRRVHPEVLEPSLGGLALTAALEIEPSLFEPWTERLKTEQDPVIRAQLLGALSSDHEPTHAARMRELIFDPRLRASERPVPLFRQMHDYRTRPAAWGWLQGKLDALAASLSADDRARLPFLGRGFCTDAEAAQVDALFRPRLGKLEGAERPLAQTLETIHLCAALVAAQRASAHDFFVGRAAGRVTRASSP
jgi:alanyl aminopeptidase